MMARSKMAIMLYSKEYASSKACKDELVAIALQSATGLVDRVIPIYVGELDMQSNFFGKTKKMKQQATLVRTKISGNCLPPPDQGLFQDNWDANMEELTKRCKDLVAEADEEAAERGGFGFDSESGDESGSD